MFVCLLLYLPGCRTGPWAGSVWWDILVLLRSTPGWFSVYQRFLRKHQQERASLSTSITHFLGHSLKPRTGKYELTERDSLWIANDSVAKRKEMVQFNILSDAPVMFYFCFVISTLKTVSGYLIINLKSNMLFFSEFVIIAKGRVTSGQTTSLLFRYWVMFSLKKLPRGKSIWTFLMVRGLVHYFMYLWQFFSWESLVS